MTSFNWVCPFCGHASVVTEENYLEANVPTNFTVVDTLNQRVAKVRFIVCPNKDCLKFTLYADLYVYWFTGNEWVKGDRLNHWKLVPASEAKVFPDYVPKVIRDDYVEACLIRDLSPKASATLSRRCLQGMIRDFFGVKEDNLYLEIEAIKTLVDPLTWQAIDATRKIGNIGAHMEKDINLIIDVEPEEANQLIKLIEILVKDWYIHKHEREQSLQTIVDVGDKKTSQKKEQDNQKEDTK